MEFFSGNRKLDLSLVALAIVTVAAFALFLINNDFPYWYHADEPGKAELFLEGVRSFLHPQLMIEILRIGTWFKDVDGIRSVVEIGRLNSALFGAVLVVLTYFLGRRVLPAGFALTAAAVTGFSPLIVVHAHYLKEDIYMAVFFAATLVALIRYLDTRRNRDAILLGAMLGLAISSKYPGLLLLVPVLAAPLLDSTLSYRFYAKALLVVGGIAALVIVVVNYGAFYSLDAVVGGLRFETKHILKGHSIRVWFWDTWFGFHLTRSLMPGLTIPVTLLALAGLTLNLVAWRRVRVAARVMVVGAVSFYLAHEITPTKPHPDFMRYMVPLAPLLAVFAAQAARALVDRLPVGRRKLSAWVLALVMVLVPLTDSVGYVIYLDQDTRGKIPEISKRAVYGYYTINWKPGGKRRDDVMHLGAAKPGMVMRTYPQVAVISSFAYDRFLYGETLSRQRASVHRNAGRFKALMACEHQIIQPVHKSFAFSNPTIRIIDLEKCPTNPFLQ